MPQAGGIPPSELYFTYEAVETEAYILPYSQSKSGISSNEYPL